VVSGHHGDLVYAAASATTGRGTLVVVASRHADAGLGPASRWFVNRRRECAAGRGGGPHPRPPPVRLVRQVDAAARRIAGGELATRLLSRRRAHRRAVRSRPLGQRHGRRAAAAATSSSTPPVDLPRPRTPLTSIRGYAEAISDGAT
jgi:hypothetical protein